jgi:predicted MFS family arabinose efflux permease
VRILGRRDKQETGTSEGVPQRSADLYAPLQRPAFRRLAFTFTLNELADWMAIIALAVLVYDETGSALATTALFLGTHFVPAALGPALVVRAERTPPRLALPALYVAEAVIYCLLALLASQFSLLAVIVVATLDASVALAGRSVTRGVVAALLSPTGELRSGNAILNIGFTGGAAAGPAIAGVLVAGIGVESALLLGAAGFALMAAIMATTPLPFAEPEEGHWRERFRAGLVYATNREPLRRLLLATGALFVFFTLIIPIWVIYATESVNAGDSGYGALLASWGVGMLFGSLIFASVRRSGFPMLLLISSLTIGVSYLGLSSAPTLITACALAALGGLGNGVMSVSLVSAIQEMTSSSMQARLMSVLESVIAVATGVGFLVGGLVTAGHSARTAFLVAGIGVLVVLAWASFSLSRTAWARGQGVFAPTSAADFDDSGNVEVAQQPSVSEAPGQEGTLIGEQGTGRVNRG